MKKQGQGCDCGSGCDCKPKRDLLDKGMLFLGGFVCAITLVVVTSTIVNEKDLGANVSSAGYPETITDEKPWNDENPWRGGITEEGVPSGYYVDEKPWDEHPYQKPPLHKSVPDQKKCSPVGVIVDGEYQETTCPQEEFEKEVAEVGALEEVDQMESDIEDLDQAEVELMEKLRATDPNSYEYWEIRNKIAELKAQKNEIRHKKRALLEELKLKKMQNIEQKVTQTPGADKRAIMEKCRQLGREGFAACLKEHMGKQEQRNGFGDTAAFEQRKPKDTVMYPNSLDNAIQQNNRPPMTVRDIVDRCIKERATDLKQCIREGVLEIKDQILQEARARTEQIEAEYSSYESETTNTDNENGQIGLPPPPKRFIVPSPTPYGNDMPTTEAEWQEYNQQFNSKPTI